MNIKCVKYLYKLKNKAIYNLYNSFLLSTYCKWIRSKATKERNLYKFIYNCLYKKTN